MLKIGQNQEIAYSSETTVNQNYSQDCNNQLIITENISATFQPDNSSEQNVARANSALELFTQEEPMQAQGKAGIYIPIISPIIGSVVNLFDGNTKNGAIDNTKQQGTGDCALISSVTALSYTRKGQEIIKDALEYHDGYTIVHLKGFGDFKVTDENVNKTKASFQYTTGDDDMIILELALESAIDKLVKGEAALSNEAPREIKRLLNHNESTSLKSSLTGTFPVALYYLLTGKTGKHIDCIDELNEALDEFMNNNHNDLSMTAVSSFQGDVKDDSKRHDGYKQRKFTDLNTGKEVKLIDTHGYSIKEVTQDTVTIVNPWDTSKEIKLSRQDFLDNFYIQSCDLSDNNPEQNLISKEKKEIPNAGEKTFIFRNKDGSIEEISYDKDGSVIEKRTNEISGTNRVSYYSKNTAIEVEAENNPSNKTVTYTIYDTDNYSRSKDNPNGYKLSESQYLHINQGALLDYPQFSLYVVYNLAKLEGNDWIIALSYLQANAEASFEEILEYIEANH